MVTHNANLDINTAADQIIVAESGSHPDGALPPINHLPGGLVALSSERRFAILWRATKRAFQERASRLRVRLER